MKTLIKLALTALITYGAWNAASAWVQYSKFKSAVSDLSQTGNELTTDQLHERVLALAAEYSIPLAEDAFTVSRTKLSHTVIDGSYTQSVNVLPWYAYSVPFTFHVDTFVIGTPPVK
jgi:hypothetical protein